MACMFIYVYVCACASTILIMENNYYNKCNGKYSGNDTEEGSISLRFIFTSLHWSECYKS